MIKNLCFLDLETTGFEPKKDSIVEIAFIRKKDGQETDRFDHVFLPDKSPLTPFISNLTGITTKELDQEGKKLSEEIDIINEKIGDSVIVGHNIDFDIRFLAANGVDIANNPRIDTHELARILLPGEESFALEILSRKYGFVHKDAHRAMSDVEVSVDLFEMLLKKIEELPSEFLDTIHPFLSEKTEWYARQFFIDAKGKKTGTFQKKDVPGRNTTYHVPKEFEEKYTECTKEKSIFWRIGDSVSSADATIATARMISQKEEVLIISSKLNFYDGVCIFPTPEVLLDPDRLETFSDKMEKLDDLESTFYVKAQYRHFLGFRGKDSFDIFFKERDYWKEVCVQEVENPVFQDVLRGRKGKRIMALTPRAFFRFHNLELFKDRVILIDEAEFFVSELLNYPTQSYSLYPYLESRNEDVANRALFYVTNFCKEVIEKKIDHAITPFPASVLLDSGEKLSSYAEGLRRIDEDGETHCNVSLQEAAYILEKPEKDLVRWVIYYPETGTLSFHAWKFTEWIALKDAMKNFKKIIQYRHKMDGVGDIFKSFLGTNEGLFFEDKALFSQKKLVIPADLVAANSPGFNAHCGDRALEIYKRELEGKGALVMNFSSIETLRTVYNHMTSSLLDTDISIVGEKVNGGDGKVMELLKTKENVILFTQKLLHPMVTEKEWGAIVMQKFPFLAPSPLMETVEKSMKVQGKNFWSTWIIPQVSANISRRISNYPSAKKFIFLDPRVNARWGKEVLMRAL